MTILTEQLGSIQAGLQLRESEDSVTKEKTMFMEGIFIQGDIINQNGRNYPKSEIERAVGEVNNRIQNGYSVLGEVDHPDTLNLNIDRVSHTIEKMWMEGSDGYGKLRIIPTPMGNIIKVLLENKIKLGVSSRGSGEVDHQGKVRGFEIVTVDIVANPSAQEAYPRLVYESLLNMRGGQMVLETAKYAHVDNAAKRVLARDIKRLISELNRK